LISINYRFW